MAFRVIKQRREARRNAKLEEIFLERDKLQDETMSCQDMQDVFRMYGVRDILEGHVERHLERQVVNCSSSYPSSK